MPITRPKIGAYEFVSLKGGVNPAGQELEEIIWPGLDGSSFRETGKRGKPFQLIGFTDVDTAADAKTLIENYMALKGTQIVLTDATGQEWSNVIVLDVQIAQTKAVVGAVGGLTAGAYVVRSRWILQIRV